VLCGVDLGGFSMFGFLVLGFLSFRFPRGLLWGMTGWGNWDFGISGGLGDDEVGFWRMGLGNGFWLDVGFGIWEGCVWD